MDPKYNVYTKIAKSDLSRNIFVLFIWPLRLNYIFIFVFPFEIDDNDSTVIQMIMFFHIDKFNQIFIIDVLK